jgi:hypothetical protein
VRRTLGRFVLLLFVPVILVSLVLVLTLTGFVFACRAAYNVYAQVWNDLGAPDGCR